MNRVVDGRRQFFFSLAFLISALMACCLVTVLPGSVPYRLTKIVPLLLLCIARFRNGQERFARYVGFGLLASFVGDAVIDSSFVAGLGAFLIGHVFYLLAMGLPLRTIGTLLSMLMGLGYGGFFFWLLVVSGAAPEPLRIPVTVYIIVISMMFGRAIGRAFVDARGHAANIFLFGAVLFVLSDTLIGIKRWVFPVPYASIFILLSYYAGQWLIFCGSAPTNARQFVQSTNQSLQSSKAPLDAPTSQ